MQKTSNNVTYGCHHSSDLFFFLNDRKINQRWPRNQAEKMGRISFGVFSGFGLVVGLGFLHAEIFSLLI